MNFHSRTTFVILGAISTITLLLYQLHSYSRRYPPFHYYVDLLHVNHVNHINSYNITVSPPQIKNNEIKRVSRIFQESLLSLQNPPNCNASRVLHCGHTDKCGIGCQIHYRIVCAILSNALQIPFVHSTPTWPYSDPWNKYLKPIGSTCSFSDSTRVIDWTEGGTEADKQLQGGLHIPISLSRMLKNLFPNDKSKLFWLLGQCLNFVFQLSSEANVEIAKWREKLNISRNSYGWVQKRNPLIGMHVRKTDKKRETNVFRTPEEFMDAAEQYRNFLIDSGVQFDNINVFLASEDATVLPTFQQKFASQKWNIIGFPETRTYSNEEERESQLLQVLRDITILSECDFIICTFSSNLCRLLAELQAYQDSENGIIRADNTSRIVSLAGDFQVPTFEFYHGSPKKTNVTPIRNFTSKESDLFFTPLDYESIPYY